MERAGTPKIKKTPYQYHPSRYKVNNRHDFSDVLNFLWVPILCSAGSSAYDRFNMKALRWVVTSLFLVSAVAGVVALSGYPDEGEVI